MKKITTFISNFHKNSYAYTKALSDKILNTINIITSIMYEMKTLKTKLGLASGLD